MISYQIQVVLFPLSCFIPTKPLGLLTLASPEAKFNKPVTVENESPWYFPVQKLELHSHNTEPNHNYTVFILYIMKIMNE